MSSTSARSSIVGEGGELGAGHRLAVDAELAGDGRGRGGVIAGDHADADAGVLAQGDGVLGLLARRIDDADEGEQLQVGDERQQVARRVERSRVEVAPGDRQHPHPVCGQPIVLGQHLSGRVAHRLRCSVSVEIVRRARQQDVRRTLDEASDDLAPSSSISWNVAISLYSASNGTSATRGYVLRVSSTSSPPLAARTTSAPSVGSPMQAPSRMTASLASAIGKHERLERAVAGSRHPEYVADRRIALTVDAEAPADDHELASRHLIERERSGLVGADRRCRAQRLHGLQPLDDRAFLSELLRPDREQHRHHGREARRDRRDRQRDAGQEQRVEILAAGEAQDDDQRQRPRRHDRDDHGELIELFGEWRLLLLDAAEHSGDVADLARHPGRRDDDLATASGHLRVHVGHVDAVAERSVLLRDRINNLGDGRALAGESGLFDLQGRGDEDPAIGGDLVAGFETDDVTWHQFLSWYLDPLTVASNVRRHDQHLPQGGDALGGLALLVQAHQGVDDRQGDDHQPGRDVLQRDDAHDRRTEQHQLHQVAVLAQEGSPPRLFGFLGELVRSVLLSPFEHGGGAETDGGIDVQLPTHIFGRQAIPVGRVLARRCGRRCDGGHHLPPVLCSSAAKNSSAVLVLVCCSASRSMPWSPRKTRASAATSNASAGAHFVDSSKMRDPSGYSQSSATRRRS